MFDLDFKRNLLMPQKEEKFNKDTKWSNPYKKVLDGRRRSKLDLGLQYPQLFVEVDSIEFENSIKEELSKIK
jgi:hypothetical protein